MSIFPDFRLRDCSRFGEQCKRVQAQFGIERLAIVGDRGMISQTQIDELKVIPGVDWITALRSSAIHKLVDAHQVQIDLFDERIRVLVEQGRFGGRDKIGVRLGKVINKSMPS